jgi:hypothetical protein
MIAGSDPWRIFCDTLSLAGALIGEAFPLVGQVWKKQRSITEIMQKSHLLIHISR